MRTISRRDFVNGLLAASALGPIVPAFAAPAETACGDVLARDPRVLRGGNRPAAFNIAHWMRDGRLKFAAKSVTLEAGCDNRAGSFDISEDGESYDVAIVGGGLSGLSAAFFLLRHAPKTRIIVLAANARPGGNASRDDAAPLPAMSSTAGAYCSAPYNETDKELYQALDIAWERHKLAAPVYNFFFDEHTPGIIPGHKGWNLDTFDKGIGKIPYPASVREDLHRCRSEFLRWYNMDGGPTDPPEASNPKFDELSRITFADYLSKRLHCHPLVVDFFTRYTVDCLGGTCSQVNTYSAIDFLSSDYQGDLFSFPGGTSEIAVRLTKWLADSAARKEAPVRIESEAVAVRVDVAGATKPAASVIYYKGDRFRRVTARSVIVASGSQSARHLVDHLADGPRRAAWGSVKLVPALEASVAVKSAAPFVDLGLGFDQYWRGSKVWADFIIADWTTPHRVKRDRPTVLTFYGANTAPADQLPNERMKLLSTPFSAYEQSLREDLSRVMGGTAFDFDRDVTAINLYRWGHSMIMPTTESLFGSTMGAHGELDRAKSPRRVAFAPLGPISFAGQDSEGTPSVESAVGSGRRTALEVLARV